MHPLGLNIDGSNADFITFTKENGIDEYLSVNTFTHNRRITSNRYELMAFYLDIDFKLIESYIPDKWSEEYINQQVKNIILRSNQINIPEPSSINFSGNGLHVYWLIDTVNKVNDKGELLFGANAQECNSIYNCIQNELLNNFKDLGADYCSSSVTRVLRKVDTINSKNGEKCRQVFFNDNKVTIAEMAVILPYKQEEVKEYKKTTDKQREYAQKLGIEKLSNNKFIAQSQIAKVSEENKSSFFLKSNGLNKKKMDYLLHDLESMAELGFICEGVRNNFFLYLGVACKRSGIKSESKLNKYLDLIPMTKEDRNGYITSFRSGLYCHTNMEKVSNERLLNLFNLTDEDLKLIKSHELKQQRAKKDEVNKLRIRIKRDAFTKSWKAIKKLSKRKLANYYKDSGCKETCIYRIFKQVSKEIEDIKRINNHQTQLIDRMIIIKDNNEYTIEIYDSIDVIERDDSS